MELGTLMLEHGGVPGSDKNTFSHCLYVILLYPLSKHAKSSMTSTLNGDEVDKCLFYLHIKTILVERVVQRPCRTEYCAIHICTLQANDLNIT